MSCSRRPLIRSRCSLRRDKTGHEKENDRWKYESGRRGSEQREQSKDMPAGDETDELFWNPPAVDSLYEELVRIGNG